MKITIRDTKKRVGPGNNFFKKKNVKLGKEIIMKTDKINGEWTCAEIILSRLGYGTYSCDLEKPMFLPKGIVFGFFLYKNDENEADIEFTRWNKFFSRNAQFVIQGQWKGRFWNFRRKNKLEIEWCLEWVKFTLNGKTQKIWGNYDLGSLHINLWIYGKPARSQIKIRNLKWKA